MSDDKQMPFRGPTGDDDGIEDEVAAARAANRFDIRRIIGAVFVVYGAILTLIGLLGSHDVKTKAAGININLWTGLAMLVVAALMIAWALLRPVEPDVPAERRGSERLQRAPAT
jgi:xanthine/uracil/vitamin C permease (AzgA family)